MEGLHAESSCLSSCERFAKDLCRAHWLHATLRESCGPRDRSFSKQLLPQRASANLESRVKHRGIPHWFSLDRSTLSKVAPQVHTDMDMSAFAGRQGAMIFLTNSPYSHSPPRKGTKGPRDQAPGYVDGGTGNKF